MKKHAIETIIQGLRICSRSNPQERLKSILNALDQWQKTHHSALRSKRLRVRWTAGLAAAAILAVVVSLMVTLLTSEHPTGHQRRTMAVSQYQINTTGSLQTAFRQDGLEGLERQLDRAFELYGPGRQCFRSTICFNRIATQKNERTMICDYPSVNIGSFGLYWSCSP